MEDICLIRPEPADRAAAEAFKQEFFDNGESVINGSALFDQMDYSSWLALVRQNSNAATVRDDWVVASTFFARRKTDGKLVGIIDIRHSLGQPFLAQYGGHIGYAVRPTERRKGYATQMLRLALTYAKEELGLSRVMLGCYTDNEGSNRTIVRCGGRLMETKPYTDGKPMHIYWITI